MKRWKLTYQGYLFACEHETETYGNTREEAIDYAVNTYHISRDRIIDCKEI